MDINRHNYEAFFIDYYDGSLSATERQALKLFLSENPDLKEEFEQFDSVSVPRHEITFSGKQQLKKQELVETDGIDEENYEQYFIAFYEGDLDDEKQEALMLFLDTNPQLRKEFELHSSLVLIPDTIAYTGKEELKKKVTIGYYWYAATAAAIILIFLALNFLTRQNAPVRQLERFEITHLNSRSFPGIVAGSFRTELIEASIKEVPVSLPEPEALEKEWIPVLASAGIKNISPEPKYHFLLNDRTYQNPVQENEIQKPKQRSLLAQVFRKNLLKVKDEFGIERSQRKRNKKDRNKKEPGFVRFLDGSLMVFNTITGSETELVKNYDRNGNLKNYRLEGQSITVSRKLPPGGSAE